MNTLAIVRAVYLDIAQWAVDEPARWGRWEVTGPIREVEMSRKKERAHRKSRMDERTRERLPILPLLINTVDAARKEIAERVLGGRPRHRRPPRPHPARAPRILGLGRGGGTSTHRDPDRGADRAIAPQLDPLHAAHHQAQRSRPLSPSRFG
jgi:hypothetical protein